MERHGLCGGAHRVSGKQRDDRRAHICYKHTGAHMKSMHRTTLTNAHTLMKNSVKLNVVSLLLYSTTSGQNEVVCHGFLCVFVHVCVCVCVRL